MSSTDIPGRTMYPCGKGNGNGNGNGDGNNGDRLLVLALDTEFS